MRVAVITGAVGQIGRALLHALAADGWTAVGLDLPSSVAAASDEHPGALPGRLLGLDITDDAAVRSVFAQILERHGRIDLLVNNAGISAIGAFTDHDVSTHARVMAVNYLGAVSCTQAALPALVAAQGRVVVTSSVTGFAPVLGRPAYVGAKHAVTGLFNALRPELAASGVGVTLVHPTFVTGGMSEATARSASTERSTTGDEVTPEQVAAAVVEAVRVGRDQVLVGRTARLSWHLNRLFPRTYVKIMTKKLDRNHQQ